MTDLAVVLGPFEFHAVEQGIKPMGGGFLIDIKNHNEIGPAVAHRDAADVADVIERHAARRTLVGER